MILLDTNALLWALSSPETLGPTTHDALLAAPSVHYSPISLTELRIKEMLGRLSLPAGLLEAIAAAGFTPLPYADADAEALRRFPHLVRHDPFDRMLLAQATARALNLYTSDRTLLGLGLAYVHDCRR